MSRSVSDTLRLARLRPPSKIGSRTWGAKLHVPEPPSNRPDSEPLAVPAAAVSVMLGKKAALAAPIWALADCS